MLFRNQNPLDVADVLLESLVCRHEVTYRRAGVEDGCVVLSSDFQADRRERTTVNQVSAQVHGNLAGLHDTSFSGFRKEVLPCDVEVVADDFLDHVDRNLLLLLSDDVADDFLGKSDCDRFLTEGGIGYE